MEETVVRKRRAISVTRAEDIQKEEARVRKSQPDKPIHKPRDSLFSWSSGFDNFTGFVNWAFLLLTVGGFRLFLENVIKYGIRVDPIQWVYFIGIGTDTPQHPSVLLLFYSIIPIFTCLILEKGLSVGIIPNGLGMTAHIINIIVLILVPIVVIFVEETGSFFGRTFICVIYSVLFLKLWSYIHVNLWCRNSAIVNTETNSRLRRQSLSLNNNNMGSKHSLDHDDSVFSDEKYTTKLVDYPDNLNIKDIAYFCVSPTLCYELNFPRTNRIRKRFLAKRVLEVVVGIQVIMALFQQWMIPSVKTSLIPFSNMDIANSLERLLKLSIPNHLVWLIFFYLTFHSLLNLVGEVLHFADRNFYCDWWNANNIDTFWRTWNMPVHRWALRHIYLPLVEMGYGRYFASTVVFFFSAFFHEYLVSVPLKTFRTWAFLGMMGQIPLSFMSKIMEKNFGPRSGNLVVWASLILGQPLAIMMYYHDYVITNISPDLIENYGRV